MTVQTTLRNADLQSLVELLKQQNDVKFDAIVSASSLFYEDGTLGIKDAAAQINDDGVFLRDALLQPTDIFESHISNRLGIPRQYVRRLRQERIDLLDANVNGWLEHDENRKFLVRGFRTDNPNDIGIARALLSDRYKVIDNLDILLAALDGINATGTQTEIVGADLSENKLSLKVSAPDINYLAPELLKNYRSPFSGASGADNPLVFSGFVISNSETGGGAFTITPRIVVQVCNNGLTKTKDAVRQIHIGGTQDEGVIKWSDETNQKTLDLVKSRTVDAVRTFLDVEYVKSVVLELEAASGVKVSQPTKVLDRLSKSFNFSESEQESILSNFISSGDLTSGGICQAVTATAQQIGDPDRANEFEDIAFDVLVESAKLAAIV